MADVKKINGYNIKDASARSDISSLDNRVGTLETAINTPSTGLLSQVSNLNNEMGTIGTNRAIVNTCLFEMSLTITEGNTGSSGSYRYYPTDGITYDDSFVISTYYQLVTGSGNNSKVFNVPTFYASLRKTNNEEYLDWNFKLSNPAEADLTFNLGIYIANTNNPIENIVPES